MSDLDSSDSATNIRLEELLHCLLECSEKAARIAQTFREQNELFSLAVEEKAVLQKNHLRVQDFKTLADVLVQETIKRDVGQKFPLLTSKIQGEEQNSFQNTLGETIQVVLTDSVEETEDLLCKILDGKTQVAKSLASIVHSTDVFSSTHYSSSTAIQADKLGIWIDPIDSTAEYIQANPNNADKNDIELCGLKCVCILIGVYNLQTGIPIMGIINQPFYKDSQTIPKWESNSYWGITYNSDVEISDSLKHETKQRRKIVVTSCFENKELNSIMETKYEVVNAAGAGYKSLVVAKSKADLYILSLPSTHFWDTCGPHAILSAKGGGIVSFSQVVNTDQVIDQFTIKNYQLKYSASENPSFKNMEGFIAYRDVNDLLEFLELLCKNKYCKNKFK